MKEATIIPIKPRIGTPIARTEIPSRTYPMITAFGGNTLPFLNEVGTGVSIVSIMNKWFNSVISNFYFYTRFEILYLTSQEPPTEITLFSFR